MTVLIPLPEKASSRITINARLAAMAVGAFFLLITLRPDLLFEQPALSMQLVLAIPLLLFSSLSYSKVGYRKEVLIWDKYAWISFATAYAFIMNVIGILVGLFIGLYYGIGFFLFNWLLAGIYSSIDVHYEKRALKERISKDGYLLFLQIFFGIFVLLGIV